MSTEAHRTRSHAWPDRRTRWLIAALAAVLLALPFLFVRLVPIADLPQQVAQIRLLLDALRDPSGPYAIQWLAPNRLSYGVLGLAWAIGAPLRAGALAMVLMALLWVAGLHGLAAKLARPVSAAVLASALFFNHFVYWGFLNFALGWPAFVLWFLLLMQEPRPAHRTAHAVLILLTAGLLLACHALWLAAGLGWLLTRELFVRRNVRLLALRLGALLPLIILGLVWYPKLVAAGFHTVTAWGERPWERLHPVHLVDHLLGGLRGPLEPVVLLVIAAWLVAAIVQHRGRLRAVMDRELLVASAMFTIPALFLPHLYNATIGFGERWFPIAAMCLILALPAPSLRPLMRGALAVVVLAAFSLGTTHAWMRIAREELSGLDRALAALPERPDLLGLAYGRSPALKHIRPYLHMSAYGQALRGGTLEYSFADMPGSLVVYDPPRARPWTADLHWDPSRAKTADFLHFTHALIRATPSEHDRFGVVPFLEPVTSDGNWRLYRVRSLPARG
jgi:hypothetical protein